MTPSEQAIDAADLRDLLIARQQGQALNEKQIAKAKQADLLALGALADRFREIDNGDEVQVSAVNITALPNLVMFDAERLDTNAQQNATALLKELALCRVTSPAGANLCVDTRITGLELAQVCLSFGANQLAWVPIAKVSPSSLPVVDDGPKTITRAEVEGMITRAKRTPKFAEG